MANMRVVLTNTKTLEVIPFAEVKSVRPNLDDGGLRIVLPKYSEGSNITESQYFNQDWIATVFPFILEV